MIHSMRDQGQTAEEHLASVLSLELSTILLWSHYSYHCIATGMKTEVIDISTKAACLHQQTY